MENILRVWRYNEHHIPFSLPIENLVLVCIGTDRCLGDSLGPLVGKKLKLAGIPNVYGCIDDPVHAINLRECLLEIEEKHPDATIVAIDAALGTSSNVGKMFFRNSPIRPGSGVGKELPEVGHFSLTGVVNIAGFMEYAVLQNTRLSLVFSMADSMVDFILDSITVPTSEVAATDA